MLKRGELIERSFAHFYETGAMRRTHLRHHENIFKRLFIHAGAFNLSLVLRRNSGRRYPTGTEKPPRLGYGHMYFRHDAPSHRPVLIRRRMGSNSADQAYT